MSKFRPIWTIFKPIRTTSDKFKHVHFWFYPKQFHFLDGCFHVVQFFGGCRFWQTAWRQKEILHRQPSSSLKSSLKSCHSSQRYILNIFRLVLYLICISIWSKVNYCTIFSIVERKWTFFQEVRIPIICIFCINSNDNKIFLNVIKLIKEVWCQFLR